MKDEYDDVTPDMFERVPEKVKKVARPLISERQARTTLLYGSPDTEENRAKRAELRASELPDWRTNGEVAAQNKPEKAPAKPVRSGGGSSGVLPNDSKSGLDRPHLYKKGGAVKKFRHHDGIATRGKTRA